ncbi:hypothetical protein CLOP_g20108 [Closterium sp. NIES-67]|nr:hypothetical protein CLOP_g20108 [Closterium sp. NIES-67]
MRRAAGSVAVEAAEGEGETEQCRVLLLVTAIGGNGLNVVEAQHVVFVEPGLNAAAEAQAMNRVHRIGQTQRTYVHRFIVQDTVEAAIHSLARSKAAAPPHLSAAHGAVKPLSCKDRDSLTLADVTALFPQGCPTAADREAGESAMPVPPGAAQGTAVGVAGRAEHERLLLAAAAAAAAEARMQKAPG